MSLILFHEYFAFRTPDEKKRAAIDKTNNII